MSGTLPDAPRYVVKQLHRSIVPPGLETICWVEDTTNGAKSEMYTPPECIALLRWLNDREKGYVLTQGLLQSIIPA